MNIKKVLMLILFGHVFFMVLFPEERLSNVVKKTVDVIVLQDGTIFRGEIIEEIFGDRVIFETEDRVKTTLLVEHIITQTQDITYKTISEAVQDEYDALTVSPFWASLGSIIPILNIGHLYSGNWWRGLTFDAGLIAAASLQFSAKGEGALGVILIVLPLMTVIEIWKIIDAGICASKYNKKIYEELQHKYNQNNSSIGIYLRKNESSHEIGISFSF